MPKRLRDETLTCGDCEAEFVFTVSQQELFKIKKELCYLVKTFLSSLFDLKT